ncbi:MAG: alanine--tRNA ligase-related protein, partial [Phycisphaeraceae bacterium]|nr:alanine--tRNA ligase-related protein [Phycisphaeraceae bacterium]
MPCAADIRQQFIDYFVDRHAHTFVPSSSVVPHGDPTLLFANAGMNQFKDVFLDTGTREYTRAVNTQKCIRAGGKHNDLDDVGRDTYHHTFFEMLGNWSFGDYFKAEAIEWAWDLLTNVWGLPKDRLYATVFGGDEADGLEPDGEAASLWAKVTDINPAHISKWDKKDNFWEMGDTGPCGPCSEIHIDLTPDGSGAALVNRDDPRVIELWNLVFIQFNRDTTGALHPLPAKHVDTGMGFERVATVLQGKSSNYDTDVFTPLFDAIREVTDAREYGGKLDDPVDMAYRVIADHVRMATFAITDGAMPGANKADAVLRSVIRRAARHGWQTFDVHEPFLYRLVDTVASNMGDAFPELK